MTAHTLQPILPWSGLREEDRRFRLILAAVLTVFFIFGYVVPHLRVPEIEPPWEVELTPRLARIIEDRIESAPLSAASVEPTTQTAVVAPLTEQETPTSSALEADSVGEEPVAAREIETVAVTAPEQNSIIAEEQTPAASLSENEPKPVSTPEPDPAAIQAAARQKAASTGLLALSDSLAELRTTSPSIAAAAPVSAAGGSGAQAIVRRPSVLTENVAKVSDGIGGGVVDHKKVLGTPGLQPREGGTTSSRVAGAGALAAARDASGNAPRNSRSEDEIQEVLDRNKRAIYTIYNRELTRDPKLQGKVVVSITIAPSGNVTECKIIYSELDAASMEEKLVLLIKRIDFGAKAGIPAVTTRVPIEFFPV